MSDFIDIPGYEGIYQINNHGAIMSICKRQGAKVGRIIKGFVKRDGYVRVYLYKNAIKRAYYVHCLVALVFLGKNDGMQVNHKDGDKSNNHVSNLEYLSASQNVKHAIDSGLKGRMKVSGDIVHEIKNLANQNITNVKIAQMYGISDSYVSMIKNNKRWVR